MARHVILRARPDRLSLFTRVFRRGEKDPELQLVRDLSEEEAFTLVKDDPTLDVAGYVEDTAQKARIDWMDGKRTLPASID